MNAILGLDRLPSGVLPLTSVITTVSYGSRERLLIQREGWALAQEEPIGAITEYVTESGNPGNRIVRSARRGILLCSGVPLCVGGLKTRSL
jgi:hypothetical protein